MRKFHSPGKMEPSVMSICDRLEHFNLLYVLILLQETSLLGQSCVAVDGKHSSLLISYAVKLLLGCISFIQWAAREREKETPPLYAQSGSSWRSMRPRGIKAVLLLFAHQLTHKKLLDDAERNAGISTHIWNIPAKLLQGKINLVGRIPATSKFLSSHHAC